MFMYSYIVYYIIDICYIIVYIYCTMLYVLSNDVIL